MDDEALKVFGIREQLGVNETIIYKVSPVNNTPVHHLVHYYELDGFVRDYGYIRYLRVCRLFCFYQPV